MSKSVWENLEIDKNILLYCTVGLVYRNGNTFPLLNLYKTSLICKSPVVPILYSVCIKLSSLIMKSLYYGR